MSFTSLWRQSQLGTKLIGATLIFLAIVTVLSGWNSVRNERRILLEQIDAQGESLSQSASIASVESLLIEDYSVLDTYTENVAQEKNDVLFIWIERADGKIVSKAPIDLSISELDEKHYRRYVAEIIPDPDEPETIGKVILGISTHRSDELVSSRIKATILQSVLGFFALAIILSLMLKKNLADPLQQLDQQATELGRGDLDSKIILPTTDELGRLAHTLDQMRENLKSSYSEIQKQNEELKELDRLKDDFLANITHEFKTPLNGIIGLGDAIQGEAYGEIPTALQRPLEQIGNSATRLLELAEQLLAFSKTTDEATSSELLELDLSDYMKKLFAQFEHDFLRKNLGSNCVVNVSSKLQANETLLDQIFVNLVGNAIKFTDAGYVRLKAEMLSDKAIAISVEDSGIGITAELHSKIFDRFFQGFASENRKFEGSGLGLAIVKQAVDRLNGLIHLASASNQGSKFTVILPITPEVPSLHLQELFEELSERETDREDQLPMSVVTAPVPAKSEQTLSDRQIPKSDFIPEELGYRATILVVDDNEINREAASAKLRKQFEVLQAEGGAECLEILGSIKVDLVLLDLMMPVVSGFDVLEKLPEMRLDPPPPILVLSAKNQEMTIARAFRMGAVDYITKPFKQDELFARVRVHVELRHRTIQLMESLELAKAADKAKSEFLGVVSHELRSPMNSIIGMIELQMLLELTDKQREYAEIVDESATDLLGIIDQILELLDIESEGFMIEPHDFDLNEMITETLGLIEKRANKKGLELFHKVDLNIPLTLRGDANRIRQLLRNLLDNAVKFTDEGSIALNANFLSETENGVKISFEVVDTGIGIPASFHGLIFQRFTQVDSSMTRRHHGLGLGLAIVKELSELMQGHLKFESKEGIGSKFSIEMELGKG